jgi:molecular chaperone DnaK (HSP70)
MPETVEILCRMRLDLDGILEVTAVEKQTGKSKQITIANALQAKSEEEVAAGRKRIQELYESRGRPADEEDWDFSVPEDEDSSAAADNVIEMPVASAAPSDREIAAEDLLTRSRRLLDKMHADDREEAIGLHESIEAAIESGDAAQLDDAAKALKELLFFVEGQN